MGRSVGEVRPPASGERLQGWRPKFWRGWRRIGLTMGMVEGFSLAPRVAVVGFFRRAEIRCGGLRGSLVQMRKRRPPLLVTRQETARPGAGMRLKVGIRMVGTGRGSGVGMGRLVLGAGASGVVKMVMVAAGEVGGMMSDVYSKRWGS